MQNIANSQRVEMKVSVPFRSNEKKIIATIAI